jgi:hypothetical protein
MVKRLIFILFVISCFGTFGQEYLMPELPELSEKDSLIMETERSLMYQQLLSGRLFLSEMTQTVQLPEFDFRSELYNRWNLDASEIFSHSLQWSGFIPGYGMAAASPFLRNGAVFSGAAYRINDRFTMGGYSFGANTIFSAPFPNQGMNSFDVRGSTLFMQYNVSRNFKIETRVNVTQGSGF